MKKEIIGILVCLLALSAAPAYADEDQRIKDLTDRLADLEDRLAAYETQDKATTDESQATAGRSSAVSAGAYDMHVYGQIRVSVDSRTGDFANTGTSISSNASRIGFNGSSALNSDSVRVIYQAELQYEATDSVDGNQSKQIEFREGFIGVESNYGTVRFGRLTTGYKKSLEVVDPWIDSALESHAGGRQGSSELHGNFFNNAVEQENQLLRGAVTTSIWYSTLFSDSSKPLHNTGTLRNYTGGTVHGYGVKYRQGPLYLSADVISIDADNITMPGLTNGDGWQFAGRYEFNDFAFGVFYEDVEALGLGKNIYGNVVYTSGETRFIASYSENNDAVVYGNSKFKNWNLGLKRSIGDSTEIVAAFNRNVDSLNSLDFDTFTIGLNTSFGN